MNGILLLNKPKGISSFKAIRTVQKKINLSKVGHCGTLDPLATGMLPIVTNEATKYSQYLLSSDKAYTVTLQLGVVTNTYDIEGEIILKNEVDAKTLENCKLIIESFKGKQTQTPPKYSALKINGKRAYELARQDIDFELKERDITIKKINILSVQGEYIRLYVECSKGTYIRSLVHDIGQKMGCGAIMTELHRNWVSPFNKYDSINIDIISTHDLIPIQNIFKQKIVFNKIDSMKIQHGQAIKIVNDPALSEQSPTALFSNENKFMGIGFLKNNYVQPKRLISK